MRVCVQNIVNRLAKDIETDLRLHIHSHLKLDDRNPFKVGLKDRSPFLRTQPLRYFGRTLAIKGTSVRPGVGPGMGPGVREARLRLGASRRAASLHLPYRQCPPGCRRGARVCPGRQAHAHTRKQTETQRERERRARESARAKETRQGRGAG